MGEIEGSYRVLQTPGTRLGAQFNAGVSTLEPGQSLSGNMASGSKSHGRGLQIRVQGLDDSQEFFDVDVSYSSTVAQLRHCVTYISYLHCDKTAVCCTAIHYCPGIPWLRVGDSCHMALVLKSLPP